jgi:ankyrin repeat protein
LHEHLKNSDWKEVLGALEKLREAETTIIRQALTSLEDEHQSTPLHIAVRKAPLPVVKLFLSVIPFDSRQEILTIQDNAGNTPLHLACSNVEAKHDESTKQLAMDVTLIQTLEMGAPQAQELFNEQGEMPLGVFLMSPALGGTGGASLAEKTEELIRALLKDRPQLVSIPSPKTGRTLIHTAAAHGIHERVLLALLEVADKGIAEVADKAGRLPLHDVAAASSSHPPVQFAKRLVEMHPEAIIQPCKTGDTPLHLLVSTIGQNESATTTESKDVAKLVEIVLGSSDSEDKCPLLMKNRDKVRKRKAPGETHWVRWYIWLTEKMCLVSYFCYN